MNPNKRTYLSSYTTAYMLFCRYMSAKRKLTASQLNKIPIITFYKEMWVLWNCGNSSIANSSAIEIPLSFSNGRKYWNLGAAHWNTEQITIVINTAASFCRPLRRANKASCIAISRATRADQTNVIILNEILDENIFFRCSFISLFITK